MATTKIARSPFGTGTIKTPLVENKLAAFENVNLELRNKKVVDPKGYWISLKRFSLNEESIQLKRIFWNNSRSLPVSRPPEIMIVTFRVNLLIIPV